MTDRVIDAAVEAALEMSSSPDALLVFLEITHPNLGTPIWVVSDVMDYVVEGHLWSGMPFGYQLVSDEESAPFGRLHMQNVDRRIGEALRTTTGRATVRMFIRSSADFDLSQDPRVELVAGAPIYQMTNFELVDIEVNAVDISGRVVLRDYAQEPWPGLRATQTRCPGLFR